MVNESRSLSQNSVFRRQLFWYCWLLSFALLAAGILYEKSQTSAYSAAVFATNAWQAPLTEPSKSQPTPRIGLAGKRIDQVCLGDRVAGENPIEAPDDRYGKEVDRATWRRIDLRCAKRDGSEADVSMLRPVWWLEQMGAKAGGHLKIAVPECGINGDATVLALGPCSPIRPGVGNVVIGTFRHRGAAVIDLFIEGLSEPIGTTPNHRFWIEDRKNFIRADQLLPAERLNNNGFNCLVKKIAYRSNTLEVFNLETYPHHVYRVSNTGRLLVHNAASSGTPLYHGTTTNETVTTAGVDRTAAERIVGDPTLVDQGGFSLTTDPEVARAYAETRAAQYGGEPVVIETTAEELAARGIAVESGTEIGDAGELKIPWDQADKVQPGDFRRSCP